MREILNSNDKIQLVMFYGPNCGPCKMLRPLLESYQGEYDVHFLNINDNMEVARQYGIRAVPTVFIFKNGIIVNAFKGYVGKTQLDYILNISVEEEIAKKPA